MDTKSERRTTARTKWAVTTVAAGLIVTTFLFAEGESIQPFPALSAILLTTWWISPLTGYLVACRTLRGAIAIGLGFVLGVVAFLVAIYTSGSSTAAIGFFTVPMLLWLGIGGGILCEWMITTARRSRP